MKEMFPNAACFRAAWCILSHLLGAAVSLLWGQGRLLWKDFESIWVLQSQMWHTIAFATILILKAFKGAYFFFFYRKETLNSSEVTLAVCVKHKNVLSINMANHHQVKDNIPFPWTSCRGTILCVFGKHNPSTCILYLHPLVLASPNPHFFCTNCITCRQENAVL